MRRDAPGHPGHEVVALDLPSTDYDGDRDLAALRVRAGYDGRVGDGRVRDQERLELRGRHLVGANLDELLEPVDDEHVAVPIDVPEVAGSGRGAT